MINHSLIIYSFVGILAGLLFLYLMYKMRLVVDPRYTWLTTFIVLTLPMAIFFTYQYIIEKPCAFEYTANIIPGGALWINKICTIGYWLINKLLPLIVIAFIYGMGKLVLSLWYTRKLILKYESYGEYSYIQDIINSESRYLKLTPPKLVVLPFLKGKAFVFGIRKPVIAISQGLLSQLNEQEITMIIIHELAHIKEKHILTTWVGSVLKDIMVYNPLAHWCYGFLLQEKEKVADSYVLRRVENPLDYGALLLKVWKIQKNYNLSLKDILIDSARPLPNFISQGDILESRIKIVLANKACDKGQDKTIKVLLAILVVKTGLILALIC